MHTPGFIVFLQGMLPAPPFDKTVGESDFWDDNITQENKGENQLFTFPDF